MKTDSQATELFFPSVTLKKILDRTGDHFQQILQWSESHNFDNCFENQKQAETLIELVEIEDCGSTGGFGKTQPEGQDLFQRWDWLYRKYIGDPSRKRFGCSSCSYMDIKKFYETKRTLRNL